MSRPHLFGPEMSFQVQSSFDHIFGGRYSRIFINVKEIPPIVGGLTGIDPLWGIHVSYVFQWILNIGCP